MDGTAFINKSWGNHTTGPHIILYCPPHGGQVSAGYLVPTRNSKAEDFVGELIQQAHDPFVAHLAAGEKVRGDIDIILADLTMGKPSMAFCMQHGLSYSFVDHHWDFPPMVKLLQPGAVPNSWAKAFPGITVMMIDNIKEGLCLEGYSDSYVSSKIDVYKDQLAFMAAPYDGAIDDSLVPVSFAPSSFNGHSWCAFGAPRHTYTTFEETPVPVYFVDSLGHAVSDKMHPKAVPVSVDTLRELAAAGGPNSSALQVLKRFFPEEDVSPSADWQPPPPSCTISFGTGSIAHHCQAELGVQCVLEHLISSDNMVGSGAAYAAFGRSDYHWAWTQ
eukprot:gene1795-2128_t